MRRTPTIIAAGALAVLALAGCGSSAKSTTAATPTTSAPASASSFPVTEGGITVAAKPAHIVSLSPTATDMLFAIGAGGQVAAVDSLSDYFSGCTALHLACQVPTTLPPHSLSAYKPNAEVIAALNPDLVVISSDENKIKESLTALKIPVYVAPAAVTIDDTYSEMSALGALTGNATGAAAAVTAEKSQISTALAALKPVPKPLSYYYELDQTFYTVTSKTFVGSVFTMAHMVNIADTAGKGSDYPQLSAEVIIKANPNAIFLADTQCCKQSPASVATRPGWSTMTAVKDNHVFGLNDSVASQWGTRIPQLLTQIVNASNSIAGS